MKEIIKILIIGLALTLSSSVIASENVVITSLKDNVYMLSTKNRWERLYENEKFISGFRLKTEKDSIARLKIGGEIEIIINENSLFELNDNFSDRSSLISIALFYGSLDISSNSLSKKIRLVTPYNIISIIRGRILLSVDESHRTDIKEFRGKISLIKDDKEELLNDSGLLFAPVSGKNLEFYINEIQRNMDVLKNAFERYETLSNRFDVLSEKKFSSKKDDTIIRKEIDDTLNNIFSTLTAINEAKNKINIFSTFLKSEIEEMQTKDDELEIPETFEDLRNRQQELNNLKERYNRIITSEIYSILKTYDQLKNGRKKK